MSDLRDGPCAREEGGCPGKRCGRRRAPEGGPEADQPNEFTIALDRQQLIGVTYATAETKPLRRTLRTFGVVAATSAKHWDYVARVDGYVHNLDVSAPGDRVEKGQVLMDIYSPDLVATENEYVDLLRMRDNGRRDQNAATKETAERLLAGTRARLQQWNISDSQIDAVEKAGAAEQYLPLTSPVNGVVEEVAVHQGRHVAARVFASPPPSSTNWSTWSTSRRSGSGPSSTRTRCRSSNRAFRSR